MEKNKSKIAPIVGCTFLLLVIISTIAGFFDVGSFGAVLGIAIASFIIFVIIAMFLNSSE